MLQYMIFNPSHDGPERGHIKPSGIPRWYDERSGILQEGCFIAYIRSLAHGLDDQKSGFLMTTVAGESGDESKFKN